MPFELKIALRFLSAGKGQTVFILLGIAIGVSVQIFLNTLITGLQDNLINQTVGTSAHITIKGGSSFDDDLNPMIDNWEQLADILKDYSGVTAVSPMVQTNGFLNTNDEKVPVILKGLTIDMADGIYNITDQMISGSPEVDSTSVLIGSELSDEYNLDIDDVIRITLSNGSVLNYNISGIFEFGNSISNSSWIIMDMSHLQKVRKVGLKVDMIELQIEDVFKADTLGEEMARNLNDVEVENWIDSNASLLTALQSQSSSSIMIQVFVLLAITLGIASVLAVSVVQKSKQLGILKAMGTKNARASRIFLLQGALLGVFGSALGALIGIGLIKGFLWGTSMSSGTPLFPLQIELTSIFIIMGIAVVSSTLAALIPAKRSSKLNPVEVIRNG